MSGRWRHVGLLVYSRIDDDYPVAMQINPVAKQLYVIQINLIIMHVCMSMCLYVCEFVFVWFKRTGSGGRTCRCKSLELGNWSRRLLRLRNTAIWGLEPIPCSFSLSASLCRDWCTWQMTSSDLHRPHRFHLCSPTMLKYSLNKESAYLVVSYTRESLTDWLEGEIWHVMAVSFMFSFFFE